MSFSKSKVSRFGDKPEIPAAPHRTSTSDLNRGRNLSRNLGGDNKQGRLSLSSKSFVETINKPDIENLETSRSVDEGNIDARKSSTTNKFGFQSKIAKPTTSLDRTGVHQLKKEDGAPEHNDHNAPGNRGGSQVSVGSQGQKTGTKFTSGIRQPSKRQAWTPRLGTFLTNSPVKPQANGSTYRSLDFNKRNMEGQYNMKMKKLAIMKKDLLEKQKPVIDLYKTIINLRKKILDSDGTQLPLDDLKIVEFHEYNNRQLRDDSKEREADVEKVKEAKTKLLSTPTTFMELCRKILDEKCSIIDQVFDDEGEWSQDDLLQRIQRYKEETAILEGQIEGRLKEEEGKLKELVKEWTNISIVPQEQDEEAKSDIEIKFQETEHRLKQALADLQFERSKKLKDIDRVKDIEKELTKQKEKVLELSKNLEEERAKVVSYKERQSIIEQKMKVLKGKVRETEVQKLEEEKKLEHLNNVMRKQEDSWRSKEVYYENRNKEMLKTIKGHEQQVAKLESEKHTVDIRFDSLRKEYEEQNIRALQKISALENSLKEKDENMNELLLAKERIETEYDTFRSQNTNVQVYNHHFFSICRKRISLEDTPEGTATTDKEMELLNELDATASALRLAEEKLALYADEKTRFIKAISDKYDIGDATSMSYAMEKEALITNLILKNRELESSLNLSHEESEVKTAAIKALKEKISAITQRRNEGEDGVLDEVIQLQNKLDFELDRVAELEQRVSRLDHERASLIQILQEYEVFLKLRDSLLNMVLEKKHYAVDENEHLKDYIHQIRSQIFQFTKEMNQKDKDLFKMSQALEENNKHTEELKFKIKELESNLQEAQQMRVILQENISLMENELRLSRKEIAPLSARADHAQFINHVRTLSNQDLSVLRSKLRLQLSRQIPNGPACYGRCESLPQLCNMRQILHFNNAYSILHKNMRNSIAYNPDSTIPCKVSDTNINGDD